MGLFKIVGNFLDSVFELIVGLVGALIATAILAVGAVIELAADILSWIDDGLKELLDAGSTEVNVIKGSAIADFIRINQDKGNYTEITYSQLKEMNTSVINVANNDSEAQKIQMIKSERGLSNNANEKFAGKDVLKIKIA
ncbi:MAG: hypothetical protein IKL75_03275 [Bacteroidaceae bacterium]|nr:hypothetical protein [Bacteroidaceae bacterium]